MPFPGYPNPPKSQDSVVLSVQERVRFIEIDFNDPRVDLFLKAQREGSLISIADRLICVCASRYRPYQDTVEFDVDYR